MWRPITNRIDDQLWAVSRKNDNRWVIGILEAILLLVAIAIVGALVGLI